MLDLTMPQRGVEILGTGLAFSPIDATATLLPWLVGERGALRNSGGVIPQP